MVEFRQYPEREIYAYGRYLRCQILNWNDGPPPTYIVCNPLDADYREEFLAKQGMGTWMRADPREVASALSEKDTALREAERRLAQEEARRYDIADSLLMTGMRLEAAEAEIERMTPQFVAYEYLESPAGREIAEAQVAELRKTLEWMRDRDNENGSLPPAYRSKIDSALTPTKEASDD